MEGTPASLEDELYIQDENVAEAEMVRRSRSNPRTPLTMNIPTIANEVWRRVGSECDYIPYPATRIFLCELSGAMKSLQFHRLVSSVVHHVKGSEGHLSQRINCYASNAGTGYDSLRDRLADSQCRSQGSEVVVVGGVTTTQGEWESRSQGEGLYMFDTLHDTQMRTDKSPYHGLNLCST